MNDLIIGCSFNYQWDILKYWCTSLSRCGFEGKKVLFVTGATKETIDKIHHCGIDIVTLGVDEAGNSISSKTNLAPHVERFVHLYEFLLQDQYRYVVTTDVKDVIFQKNPIEWLEKNIGDKQYVFSSESLKYKDEPWGNTNLFETFGPYFHERFKDNEIFNVGVLAGKGASITSLCANIFVSSINKPIPICDQSTFNFMISQEPYLGASVYTRSEDGWACQLGTTADPSKMKQFKPFLLENSPKLVGDKVFTDSGKEFTIVHQYDRIPGWKEIIEKKYSL